MNVHYSLPKAWNIFNKSEVQKAFATANLSSNNPFTQTNNTQPITKGNSRFKDKKQEFNQPKTNPCDEVVVVGLIGKGDTRNNSLGNIIVGLPVFRDAPKNWQQSEQTVQLEGYFDEEKGIIYLNLVSLHNVLELTSLINSMQSFPPHKFQEWAEGCEHQQIKAMLFMFLVCHLVLVRNNSATFDASYLQLFRTLRKVKEAALPNLEQFVASFSIVPKANNKEVSKPTKYPKYKRSKGNQSSQSSSIFIQYPGNCVPFLYFIFYVPPSIASSSANSNTKKSGSKKERGYESHSKMNAAEESLKQSLDAQIRTLLRKNRLLKSDMQYNKSLFVVENKNCIYLVSRHMQECSSVPMLNLLLPTMLPPLLTSSNEQILKQNSRAYHYDASGISRFVQRQVSKIRSITSSAQRASLPSAKQWYTIALGLQSVVFPAQINTETFSNLSSQDGNIVTQGIISPLNKAKQTLNPALGFSKALCERALQYAIADYKQKLPNFYHVALHKEKLKRAEVVFTRKGGSGPAVTFYIQKLHEFCEKYYKMHQLCTAVSLTSRPCLHRMNSTDPNDIESCKSHESGYKSLCACNCGATRLLRKDPFDLKAANFDFFEYHECCNNAIKLRVPIDCEYSSWSLLILGNASWYDNDQGINQEGFLADFSKLFTYAFPISFVQENDCLNLESKAAAPSSPNQKSFLNALMNSNLLGKENETSTCNEIAQKLHDVKNRNLALQKSMGFLSPDLYRQQISTSKMPTNTHECEGGSIGFEYECPKGHRFFLPPNVVEKQTKPKEKCTVSLVSSYPVFMSCPCTQTNQSSSAQTSEKQAIQLAQLQRVFIITKDSTTLPLLSIQPSITFTKSSKRKYTTTSSDNNNKTKTWHFGFSIPVTLPPNSALCLRLPFVYVIEDSPVLQTSVSVPFNAKFSLL